MNNTISSDNKIVLARYVGRRENATYRESPLDYERNNAFIAALPAQLGTPEEIGSYMTVIPAYRRSYLSLPLELRINTLSRLDAFLQPNERHIKIFRNVTNLIRAGYLGRNPQKNVRMAERQANIQVAVESLLEPKSLEEPVLAPNSLSTSLFGISRMGKSHAIHRSLDFYPQIIDHGEYHGEKFTRSQLVWLHLDCPKNGNVETLVLTLMELADQLLGTKYFINIGKSGRASGRALSTGLYSFLPELGLGVLAIDELQYLRAIISAIRKIREEKPGSRTKMTDNLIHLLVTLDNFFGIPTIFVGTPPAAQVISTRAHLLFRSERIGNPDWRPLEENSADWIDFVNTLCSFPLLKTPTDPAHIYHNLHDVSFGIPGVAIVMFKAAHEYLIDQNKECFDANTFDKTLNYFPKLGKAIKQLQSMKDLSVLELMDDVLNLTDNDDLSGPKQGQKGRQYGKSNSPQSAAIPPANQREPKDTNKRQSKGKVGDQSVDLGIGKKDADEFVDE